MEELKKYVDKLFEKYHNTPDIENLKDITLKKLIQKQVSYQEQGLDKQSAIEKAKTAITEIDNLIPGNIKVCKNQYNIAFLQHFILSLLIGWLFIVPCNLVSEGLTVQMLILWGLLISGIAYLWLRSKRSENFWNETTFYSKDKTIKMKKLSWLIYLFIVIGTAIFNIINFSTPDNIMSSHLASKDFHSFLWIIYHCFSPLLLIVYPIGIGSMVKLLEKAEHKVNRTLEFISILLLIIITICLYLF